MADATGDITGDAVTSTGTGANSDKSVISSASGNVLEFRIGQSDVIVNAPMSLSVGRIDVGGSIFLASDRISAAVNGIGTVIMAFRHRIWRWIGVHIDLAFVAFSLALFVDCGSDRKYQCPERRFPRRQDARRAKTDSAQSADECVDRSDEPEPAAIRCAAVHRRPRVQPESCSKSCVDRCSGDWKKAGLRDYFAGRQHECGRAVRSDFQKRPELHEPCIELHACRWRRSTTRGLRDPSRVPE